MARIPLALCPLLVLAARAPGPDVFAGSVLGRNVAIIGPSANLEAVWQDNDPADAGVSSYDWAIGTSPGATDIQDWVNVGMSMYGSGGGQALWNGVTYYASVRAVFGDGTTGAVGSSAGVLVDLNPPDGGTVYDGDDPARESNFQSSTSTASANWTPFHDGEGGVAYYEWAIGTSSGATDVQDFRNAGSSLGATATGLHLVSGHWYYVSVRAVDRAGNVGGASSSSGFFVDAEPPTPGGVSDGSAGDIDTQASITTIRANWSGFSDNTFGIQRYEWAIGTTAGGADVAPFSGVGQATSAVRTGLALRVGQRYFASVRAFDIVGSASPVVSSDGVLISDSGPTGGIVNDGEGADLDLQTSRTTIRANWSGFTPQGSPISSYRWAIGRAPGASFIQDYVDVGLATSASRSNLNLPDGTYYVTVIAMSAEGVPGAEVSSNGVTIDTAGPLRGQVEDGLGPDEAYQDSLQRISAHWSVFPSPGFGLDHYECRLVEVLPEFQVIRAWQDVGSSRSVTYDGLELIAGRRYQVWVRGIDAAGTIGLVANSNGFLAWPTPAGCVADGPGEDLDEQDTLERLDANWSALGLAEAGPLTYDLAIGTTPGGGDVMPFLAVGSVTATSIEGAFAANTTYYVTVRARFGGGRPGPAATSDGIRLLGSSHGNASPCGARGVPGLPAASIAILLLSVRRGRIRPHFRAALVAF